jgi:hypothetical protein
MRYLITILTLITVGSYGQKVHTGTYYTSRKDIGFTSDIFHFEKDGTFRCVSFGCTGSGLGKGKYEVIQGDSLRLQFTDCEECDEFIKIESSTDSSENLDIDLQVLYFEDNSALPGVNVYFPETKKGVVTDQNGKARFSTSKLYKTEVLRIQFVGYAPVDIEIPKQTTKVKGVIRMTDNWVYDGKQIMTFKIISWTHSRLRLQRHPRMAISYDRISSEKSNKLVEERLGEMGYRLFRDKICMPSKDIPTL